MKLHYAARTHVGLVRPSNEDSILTMPESGLFLVADGMGGEVAGEEASAQVVESVKRVFHAVPEKFPVEPEHLEDRLREAIRQAHRDVFNIARMNPLKRGLGSTASLMCVHRDAWMVAQIGDSRVYLVREGLVRQITTDHTVVWQLYQQGMIEREQLGEHPSRHLLTQCVGSGEPIDIDFFEGISQTGDLFLICSDGLTGYVGEESLEATLVDPALELEQKADHLVDAALAGGGGDNISVILVTVELERGDNWLALSQASKTKTTRKKVTDTDETSY